MYWRKDWKAYWLQIIEKEIEKLEAGDMASLLMVYCAFAMDDKALMRRAGGAIRRQLEGWPLREMIRLCERFRSFTSLEWSIDWADVSVDKICHALEAGDRKYVLILGSFHPNGYFRERSMAALTKEKGALPYLMLRANDWVRAVRDRAFFLLHDYLKQCDTEEILSAMPVLEKLQRSGRRSDAQLRELKRQIFACLEQNQKNTDWSRVWPEDFFVRKSLYRISMEMGWLTLEQMDDWLRRERDFCGKMMLIKGILAHPDCTLAQAERYLTYPSAQVRKKALEYKYEQQKDSWPGLEEMLLDPGKGVRDYAAYILERYTDLDIRSYYLEHLKDEKPEYAILGLSENSRRGNVPALLECLHNPSGKIQKCALLALGVQEDFEDQELLWNYLLDDRVEVSKAAYLSMQKREFYPGAERLYQAYRATDQEHIQRYLLRLLLRERSWSRLPWLIRMYSKDLPEQEIWLIRGGIGRRFMYEKVSATQKEEVDKALEENGEALPKGVAEEILYDMKFV